MDVSRRGAAGLGFAGLLAGAGLSAGEPPKPEVAVWDVVPCPGCGRDVCFELDQKANRCAWCGADVPHQRAA